MGERGRGSDWFKLSTFPSSISLSQWSFSTTVLTFTTRLNNYSLSYFSLLTHFFLLSQWLFWLIVLTFTFSIIILKAKCSKGSGMIDSSLVCIDTLPLLDRATIVFCFNSWPNLTLTSSSSSSSWDPICHQTLLSLNAKALFQNLFHNWTEFHLFELVAEENAHFCTIMVEQMHRLNHG